MESYLIKKHPEFIILNNTLEKFVKESTKTFDESHNYDHMFQVTKNAFAITNSDVNVNNIIEIYSEIPRLILISSWLHDVRDHKYPDSISEEVFEAFIKSIEPIEYKTILKVIRNVSWSKENKGEREDFNLRDKCILDVVSDADRIEALGYVGIKRCKDFVKSKGGVEQDVINHCKEKLLRILPDNFIKTYIVKEMAKPLHNVIQVYVENFELRKET